MTNDYYTDGGCVGMNPSKTGGTWAWVAVTPKGNESSRAAGVITPIEAGVEAVSNNLTELLAAIMALEDAEAGWDGTLHTDSYVTLCRLTRRHAGFKGIPDHLRQRLSIVRGRLGLFRVALLDGHPTRKQLASGRGKRGNPVSKWNVLCDDLCSEQAFLFRKGK